MHEHPAAKPPQDPNVKIWRYMDFAKWMTMLENKGLYLPRATLLGDPLEGSYPRANQQLRATYSEQAGIPPAVLQTITDLVKWSRDFTFISCWHMNDRESAGMWSLYSKTHESIAIQSTYARLVSALEATPAGEGILVGVVQYIDYETQQVPESNIVNPFFYKRKHFEHERELRIVLPAWPTKEDAIDREYAPTLEGLWMPLDLTSLVETVCVSPKAPAWFHDLVQRIMERYGLDIAITQSSIDQEPFF